MQNDIYITAIDGSDEIQIPWLPESISFNSNTKLMAAYSILDSGEVKIPSGRNLRDFSWSSIFPGEGHKDLPFLRTEWRDPKTYQGILSRWFQEGTPLRLLITGTPINHDVYLADYKVAYSGGHGDYSYNIMFVEKRDIIINSQKTAGENVTTNNVKSNEPASSTYTIKSGDTLWSIAQKQLGDGKKYSDIYVLNQTIIEETAKKRGKSSSEGGKWIYAGTVIKLPGSATASTGSGTSNSTSSGVTTPAQSKGKHYIVTIKSGGQTQYAGRIRVSRTYNGKQDIVENPAGSPVSVTCDANTKVTVYILPINGRPVEIVNMVGYWHKDPTVSSHVYYNPLLSQNSGFTVNWKA